MPLSAAASHSRTRVSLNNKLGAYPKSGKPRVRSARGRVRSSVQCRARFTASLLFPGSRPSSCKDLLPVSGQRHSEVAEEGLGNKFVDQCPYLRTQRLLNNLENSVQLLPLVVKTCRYLSNVSFMSSRVLRTAF